MNIKTPAEVYKSASPEVRRLLSEILKIEQEYQHFQWLDNRQVHEIGRRIVKLIEKEVKP